MRMEEKLISIVVPVYNVEKYLDKCIQSVVDQTYSNLEIILVDDGSPDNCPAICDEWAKKDSRIRVIHKANGGLSDARNYGIDAAKGDYIMFVDSDDYLSINICTYLCKLVENHNADFAVCDAYEFEEGEIPEKVVYGEPTIYEGEDVVNQLYNTKVPYLMTATGKLYKMKFFENLRYPVGKLHEDEFVFHYLIGMTQKFVHLDAKLYYYLQRQGSIMNGLTIKNFKHRLEAFKDRYNYLEENFKNNHEKNANLYLLQLRNTYSNARNLNIEIEGIDEEYNKIYDSIEKHSLKDKIFRNYRKFYNFLYKLLK